MKIKLIQPARKKEWGEDFFSMVKSATLLGKKAWGTPLSIATLAGLTPKNKDIMVILNDENVSPINFDEDIDLVCISFSTPLAPRAYEIADEFRKRKILVILGGIHASMLPEEAKSHCNSVVIGEAEEIWGQVILDFKNRNLKPFYKATRFPDLSNSVIPRWDLLNLNAYRFSTIQVGRGCPYDCEFCSVKIFNGNKYRFKKIENIISEIKFLKELAPKNLLFFVDDNLLAIPKYAEEFLAAVSTLGIKGWGCQASINRLDDSNLLYLLSKAGCAEVLVGFESVSQNSLDLMGKSNINKVNEFKRITDKVHRSKIAIFGSFVVGSDNDDESIFDKTLKFIKEVNLGYVLINVLTPFPGTDVYKRYKTEGRLLNENWEKFDGKTINFIPKKMSLKTLQDGYRSTLQKLYSFDALYLRFSKLWGQRLYVLQKDLNTLNKNRLLFFLKNAWSGDINKIKFIFKSLNHVPSPCLSSIAAALNFHDYTFGLSQSDSPPDHFPQISPQ